MKRLFLDTIIFILIVRTFIKEYKTRQFKIDTVEMTVYAISVCLISMCCGYSTAFLLAALYFITCMSSENKKYDLQERFLQDVRNVPIEVWRNQSEKVNFEGKQCNLDSSMQIFPDTGTPHSGIIQTDCLKDLARTRISSNNCCNRDNPQYSNDTAFSGNDLGFVSG